MFSNYVKIAWRNISAKIVFIVALVRYSKKCELCNLFGELCNYTKRRFNDLHLLINRVIEYFLFYQF